MKKKMITLINKKFIKKIAYINFATRELYESEMVSMSGSKNWLAIFL